MEKAELKDKFEAEKDLAIRFDFHDLKFLFVLLQFPWILEHLPLNMSLN